MCVVKPHKTLSFLRKEIDMAKNNALKNTRRMLGKDVFIYCWHPEGMLFYLIHFSKFSFLQYFIIWRYIIVELRSPIPLSVSSVFKLSHLLLFVHYASAILAFLTYFRELVEKLKSRRDSNPGPLIRKSWMILCCFFNNFRQ